MNSFPTETLIHIFSYLDIKELKLVNLVCSKWCNVMKDESCWRYAFEQYFGGLPFRRLNEKSWRDEYLQRAQMAREWCKGKKIFQFDPNIGNIDKLYVNLSEDCMYAASLSKGIIAKCNPYTGKVNRDPIYTNVEHFTNPVSSILLERHRILVGNPSGDLVIITNIINHKEPEIETFRGMHDGPVTVINTIDDLNYLISGGWDGCLNVYDVNKREQVLRIAPGGEVVFYGTIKNIIFHQKLNAIIAGTDKGRILVYTGLAEPPKSQNANFTLNLELEHNVPIAQLDQIDSCFLVLAQNAKSVHCKCGKTGEKRFELVCKNVLSAFTVGCQDSESCLLATADVNGCIYVYKLLFGKLTDMIDPSPSFVIHSGHSAIMNIHVDRFKIVSCSSDGFISVFNVINGSLIKTLKTKSPRQGQNYQVSVDEYQLFITSNDSIKCFNFRQEQITKSKRKSNLQRISLSGGLRSSQSSPNSASPRNMHGSWKQSYENDFRNDIEETEYEREFERKNLEYERKIQYKYNGIDIHSPGPQKLTEEELTQYAIALSRQSSGIEESDPHLLQAIQKSMEVASSSYRSNASNSFNEIGPSSFGGRTSRKKYEKWEQDRLERMREIDREQIPTRPTNEDAELEYVLKLSLTEQ